MLRLSFSASRWMLKSPTMMNLSELSTKKTPGNQILLFERLSIMQLLFIFCLLVCFCGLSIR